ncbi:MAG: 16S rRNA (adenine(1518)-N(6)/adenine(1519)-N(6))-dimethyltransferase RsmA [Treponema sp.]|nr:16S rRNA (adenine(1518)-N(6)/adenine(1519)-N(6))-dimethyltransferase RsmA [Treponema sp.]
MKKPDYDSPSSLKNFLDQQGMAMQKKFGQNFLINGPARRRLIDALQVDEATSVWEVGPGLGAMTDEILSRGASVTAFEIDRGFATCVRDFFKDYEAQGKFTLVEGDVLKTWKSQAEKQLPNRFFGNLPYNVAATIIADMISAGYRFPRSVVTVQKEVAQRMCASVGSKDYSSFSILCSWAYKVTPLMDLGGGSFWPKPNVDSRAVVMELREDFPRCQNPEHFMKLLRGLFASRRKTIKNNLTVFYSNGEQAAAVLDEAKINPQVRAEELPLEILLHLSDISNAFNRG